MTFKVSVPFAMKLVWLIRGRHSTLADELSDYLAERAKLAVFLANATQISIVLARREDVAHGHFKMSENISSTLW